MLHELLSDENFSSVMKLHARELIEMLLRKGVNFSVLTNISSVRFDPPLPEEISSTFKPITLFVLAGYTFESPQTDEENLYFEAGFGTDNIGSFVTVPFSSVLQIIIEETPIFINLSIPSKNSKEVKKEKKNGIKRSMEALMSNPENRALLKKR